MFKMNENQERLFKALEAIDSAILYLEDAQNIIKDMTISEIEEVTERFSEEISELNIEGLYDSAFNFKGYAESIIAGLEDKMEYLDSIQFRDQALSNAGKDITIITNEQEYLIKFENETYSIKELFPNSIYNDLANLLGVLYAAIVNEKKQVIKSVC